MDINNQFLSINDIKPNKYNNIKDISLKDENDNRLKEVCNSFESFFMNHLLETSLKSSKLAGEGTGSEIIKGMYTDALSQKSSGSLGISDMLFKFLSENKS
ncbi:MAG: rod-binding protein [Campylobacterota bacterium]|nr:rod-binding protein [Campylobacterota bacterium]